MKEYVIWGIPKGEDDERLLLTSVEGKRIHDRAKAEKALKLLETKFSATNMRIQELDIEEDFDWMKSIGIK